LAARAYRGMAVQLDGSGDLPDLSLIRDESREELLEILSAFPGTKCLVFDPDITGLVNHVVVEGSKLLSEAGVALFREIKDGALDDLRFGKEDREPDHVLYLTRPRIKRVQQIAAHVKSRAAMPSAGNLSYGCYFVPHRTLACEQVLEDEGVLNAITLGEFHMDLVPFDRDLVSMELKDSFREIFVQQDITAVGSTVRALSRWQAVYGFIPNVKAKGHVAEKVLRRMLRMRVDDHLAEFGPPEDGDVARVAQGVGPTAVDTLILLDRAVDLVTPNVTPLTYEGLIDELVGIHNCQVKLDSSLLDTGDDLPDEKGESQPEAKTAETENGAPKKVSLPLNSNDDLYKEIRDKNVSALGQILQTRAKSIKELYAGFRSNRNASVSEIHAFWKQVPDLRASYKSLSQHINIAALLKRTTDSNDFRERWQIERGLLEGDAHLEEIEERLHSEEPAAEVLKLICLQSLCGGGIRSKYFDSLRRDFLQTYGYEYLTLLSALERMGMLKKKETFLDTGATLWSSIRRAFNLISDGDVDVMNPNDMAYVTSGYAPLSARMVQFAGSPGWSVCQEALRLVPGPTLQIRQTDAPMELDQSALKS